MELSRELVSEFVKVASNNSNTKQESVVYGTAVLDDGIIYARLDGTDRLTPIKTTASIQDGERVTVLIKNHTATITGNLRSPAARVDDVKEIRDKVSEFEKIVTNLITTDQLAAQVARIDTLEADNVTIHETLTSSNAIISSLQLDNVTIHNSLTSALDSIDELVSDNVTINESLTAANADIEYLKANTLTATDIEGKYANIDFSNIGKAAMEYFYANSGLIKNVTVGDATITGQLAGVTIGGFNITENSIYSGIKESVGNATRGIYLDNDGQISFGDSSNYIKYYKDQNGNYKLDISANTVVTSNGVFGRRTSSSERYKRDISVSDISELSGLYDLPVKKFKYNNDYISSDDELYDKYLYGFVVEDLEDVLPCAVEHVTDEDGNALPEMWNSNIIIPALLKLIQDLNNRVKVLEGKESA